MPSESDDTARVTGCQKDELNPGAGEFICQKGTPGSAGVSASSAFPKHPSAALQQSDIVENASDLSVTLALRKRTHTYANTQPQRQESTHKIDPHADTVTCRQNDAGQAQPDGAFVFSLLRCGCRLKSLESPAPVPLWFRSQLLHMSVDGMPPGAGNSWAREHTSYCR